MLDHQHSWVRKADHDAPKTAVYQCANAACLAWGRRSFLGRGKYLQEIKPWKNGRLPYLLGPAAVTARPEEREHGAYNRSAASREE